ncbi:muscle LIM protein 1-like [Orbicella faveolata]|uniref:muscle LIM protein 1-like n=1 Tax=Orbicella faveolata TaxID=48498 RepID=UPI0009E3563E|nr:muscle LIM protein 1-like [Orbicella faveolata]
MGNYCSVCKEKVASGKYCDRCYERKYPSCGGCGRPLQDNEERVCGYHKFPCYSQSSGQCCQCNAPIDCSLKGAYCRNCYDVLYPPPPRVRGTYNGCEMTLYLRDDEFNSKLQPLAYAFGRGLSDGGQRRYYLKDS